MAKAISTKTTVFVCMGVLLTIGTMLVATPSAYAEKTCIGVCKNHHNDVDSHDTIDNSQDNDITTNNDNDITTNNDNDITNDNDVCTGGNGGNVVPGGPGGGGGSTGGAGGACNF